MERNWFKHFKHDQMFVFNTEEGHPYLFSGWDRKGQKFENKFHFIDRRYKPIEDPEQIELLNMEFDKS